MEKNVRTTLVAISSVIALVSVIAVVKRGEETAKSFEITGRSAPPTSAPTTNPVSAPPASKPDVAPAPSPSPSTTELVVHVAGAVKSPGVYRLKQDSRNADAIKAAGGAKQDANLDSINLAARVEDGQQLYVASKKEQPNGGVEANPKKSTKPAASSGNKSAGKSGKLTAPGQGTVNINTASGEELERLPGVGPAMSARILQHRKENGKFTSPDQLMDISGIGPKKFEKMQPFVRIN